ncbi:unnamed protein product [Calypogeia fissa]
MWYFGEKSRRKGVAAISHQYSTVVAATVALSLESLAATRLLFATPHSLQFNTLSRSAAHHKTRKTLCQLFQRPHSLSVLGSPPKRSVLGLPPNLPTIPREQDYFMPSIQFGRINVYEGKTTNVDVVVNGKTIKVTLTKESSVAQDWIMQQRGKCFGLDLEWKPNRRKGQPENKVALMQISSETECLLIQMLFLDSIPSALVRFLKDPARKIAGVGIHEDTKKLRRDYGLICSGEVELSALAVSHFQDNGLKRVGLQALAKKVIGFDMDKCKSVTLRDWSNSSLERRQVEYACMDAWVSHAIFGRLARKWT